jgi:hypothetical protein
MLMLGWLAGNRIGEIAVLRLAGLKTDAVGKDRTMYSLRHTSIMAALLAGSSHDERIKLKK